MFAAQLAAAALVWAAVIALLYRRREALIARYKPLPRGRRALSGALAVFSGIPLLLLLMGSLASGGLTRGGLTWWGWLLLAVLGAAFVALQTIGLVPLVLNAASPVTREADGSSDRLDRP